MVERPKVPLEDVPESYQPSAHEGAVIKDFVAKHKEAPLAALASFRLASFDMRGHSQTMEQKLW
jgi:hypothetical protein